MAQSRSEDVVVCSIMPHMNMSEMTLDVMEQVNSGLLLLCVEKENVCFIDVTSIIDTNVEKAIIPKKTVTFRDPLIATSATKQNNKTKQQNILVPFFHSMYSLCSHFDFHFVHKLNCFP